jgi:Ca2+ transporting ATPase
MATTNNFIPKKILDDAVTKYQQRKVLCEDVNFLEEQGGEQWLLSHLETSLERGIDSGSVEKRVQFYGDNEKDPVVLKGFCELCCEALNDLILIVMCVAGVANIIINMIMEEHKETAWIEGFAILLAVAIVVLVQAINDLKKEKEFQKLNDEAEQGKKITVIRDGNESQIPISGVFVGDIVKVKSGMEIAGDGILLQGFNVQVDESSMTGETKAIHKASIAECAQKRDQIMSSGKSSKHSVHDVPTPIMISGTKIVGGSGHMLVILVGDDCAIGKIKKLVEGGEEATPLQLKLEKIARDIGIFGLVSAVLLFTALTIQYIIKQSIEGWGKQETIEHVSKFLQFFLIAITILIVAIPEGLPLAVTLSLAFSVQKMMKQNNLVRKLQACETMGGANIICSDKTGTLTQNKMFLTNFWNMQPRILYDTLQEKYTNYNDFMSTDAAKVFENVITLNSSEDPSKEEGNPTEQATLKYLFNTGFEVVNYRKQFKPIFVSDFSSDRKRSSVIVKMEDERTIVFMKGASERMLEVSNNILNLQNGEIVDLDFEMKGTVEREIKKFATQSLRTLGLCYKVITEEEMDFENADAEGVYNFEMDGFTLVGICGIKDIIKPEVPHAVSRCYDAGIQVKMVTGDNKDTAEAIAKEVNIINKHNQNDALVMEGIEFLNKIGGVICDNCKHLESCDCFKSAAEKNLEKNKGSKRKIRKDTIKNKEEFLKICDRLVVLARSRPEDKYALVVGLKERGDVVAVTGDGTNDAPALSKADVGFAMGIAGTEVAKQAADILLLDDDFSSIITAAKWGRNVYDAIKKFLQFQLTVNVVAVLTTFISAVILEKAILSAVQMLWINLIMDTLAALALATEPPREELLDRKPHKKTEYIITPKMIKHIIGQSIFQTILLLVIVFAGEKFLVEFFRDIQQQPNSNLIVSGRDYDKKDFNNQYSIHFTYIFNIFVMLQYFNFLNCRMIHDEANILKYITQSTYLIVIMIIILVLQIILLAFGGLAIRVHQWGLGPAQWGISILIGLLGIPVRYLLVCLKFEKLCGDKGVGSREITQEELNKKSSVSLRKSHNKDFYRKQPSMAQKGSRVLQ